MPSSNCSINLKHWSIYKWRRSSNRSIILNEYNWLLELEAPSLLPIVTSFVPSLPVGAPFSVSMHSWQSPQLSGTIQNSDCNSVVFEARLFLDGRLAVTKIFDHDGLWPSILSFGEFSILQVALTIVYNRSKYVSIWNILTSIRIGKWRARKIEIPNLP